MRRRIAFVGALALLTASAAASSERTQYSNTDFRWRVAYGPGLRVTPVKAEIGWSYFVNGAIVASFPGARANGSFRRFPEDGVAFGFWHPEGSVGPQVRDPEASFPLERKTFVRSRRWRTKKAPIPLYRHVVANGSEFHAYVWLGATSSRADRAAIWRVVRSLRFRRLHPGELVGESFLVMRRPERYRLRSVTRHELRDERETQPFYLVRAPGGFYALGWSSHLYRGYHRCPVQYDRARFEFYCRTNGARWDRMGGVLVNPDPKRYQDDPLDLMVGKRAWDGHLLVDFGGYSSSNRYYKRRFWPRGR